MPKKDATREYLIFCSVPHTDAASSDFGIEVHCLLGEWELPKQKAIELVSMWLCTLGGKIWIKK